MKRRPAKKHPQTSGKKEISGTVTTLTRTQMTVTTAKGAIWRINRRPRTTVIRVALRGGSTVTVKFNKNDGEEVHGPLPGKRTETGTVIKLSAQQIMLDNTSPDPQTWIVNRTVNTMLISGVLALNSIVTVESTSGDWQQVVA